MSNSQKWLTSAGIVLALILSISGLVGNNQSAGPVKSIDEMFGAAGDIVTNIVNFTKGLKSGDNNEVWISKTLPVGQNQVVLYRNITGRDQWVDYGESSVKTGETASSTMAVSLIATTTATIAAGNDFGTLNEGKRAILQTAPVATSTTASTTSSVYASSRGLGNGSVLVPDGSYLIGYLQQVKTGTVACYGAVGLCEAATSTSRGFNPVFTVRLHY